MAVCWRAQRCAQLLRKLIIKIWTKSGGGWQCCAVYYVQFRIAIPFRVGGAVAAVEKPQKRKLSRRCTFTDNSSNPLVLFVYTETCITVFTTNSRTNNEHVQKRRVAGHRQPASYRELVSCWVPVIHFTVPVPDFNSRPFLSSSFFSFPPSYSHFSPRWAIPFWSCCFWLCYLPFSLSPSSP